MFVRLPHIRSLIRSNVLLIHICCFSWNNFPFRLVKWKFLERKFFVGKKKTFKYGDVRIEHLCIYVYWAIYYDIVTYLAEKKKNRSKVNGRNFLLRTTDASNQKQSRKKEESIWKDESFPVCPSFHLYIYISTTRRKPKNFPDILKNFSFTLSLRKHY